mmetsp:Transcript_896/g.2053  ORF Transcript_896/g.2053 Transcript_896/m.2053 type:complete len:287 (+) Transcript_896:145-1005(+)
MPQVFSNARSACAAISSPRRAGGGAGGEAGPLPSPSSGAHGRNARSKASPKPPGLFTKASKGTRSPPPGPAQTWKQCSMVPRISRTLRRSTPETPRVRISALKSSGRERPAAGSAAQNSNHLCSSSALRSGGVPCSSLRRNSRRCSTIHCSKPPSAQKTSSSRPSPATSSATGCHWHHQPCSVTLRERSSASSSDIVDVRPSLAPPALPTPRACRSRSPSRGSTASRALTTSSLQRRPSPEASTRRNHCRGAFSTSGKARTVQPPGDLARHSGQQSPNCWAHAKQK